MRVIPLSLAGFALVLASCGPPPGQVGLEPVSVQGDLGVAPVADGTCNAALYQDLVGEPIAIVSTLNPGTRVRILGADEFVTRDFDPNRLTVTTTRQDTIGRIFCG